jgi:uncharacterized protein YbjT (DUF2867 family)
MNVLVTGASGNVGKAVVNSLRRCGRLPRVATSRRSTHAEPGPGADDNAVVLDFHRPETFAPALANIDVVFLIRPPAISDVARTLNAFVDVAVSSGVAHVVFLSVIGADRRSFVPHAKVEAHLRAAKIAWTFLRPGFFAQNLGDAYRQDIVEDNRIYVPAGAGRAAFVDVRDVAEVAVMAMESSRHRGKAYALTGAEELCFADVAAILTAELQRDIRYDPASILGYAAHLRRRRRMPFGQVAVQTILHALLRRPGEASPDPTLAELLQRPPTTLARYVHDHRDLWRPTERGSDSHGT